MVNKSKITFESTFNGDHLGIEANNGGSKDGKILSGVLLQIYDYCFNTYIPKHLHLRFSKSVSFFQFFTDFL